MAAHKVPQDVEADDKFLGPLSFKQFIFFGLTIICGYITFLLITKNLAFITPVFVLPMIVFGFLAFPWSKEQPTELWLAARIRFLIKPRKRIWDQSGAKELVNITVPKQAAHAYTDGLSQHEVKDRLSALATMVDSRGWAVKNYSQNTVEPSDRLVDGNVSSHSPVVPTDVPDDVMDEDKGVIAQQFESKIQESEQKIKSEARKLIEEARQEATAQTEVPDVNTPSVKQKHVKQPKDKDSKQEDFWFMHQQTQTPSDPNLATFGSSSVVKPGENRQDTAVTSSIEEKPLDEAALLEKAHEKQRRDALQTSHIKHFDPFAKKDEPKPEAPAQPAPTQQNTDQKAAMTTDKDPDILKYVYNNDLDVETIQRQGHKKDNGPEDEVVISLH